MSPGQALRHLGSGRHPLRRATDRVEAWLTVALLVAAVVGLPSVAWRAGHAAYAAGLSTEREERAQRFRVPATLVAEAPAADRTGVAFPNDDAAPREDDPATFVPASARWAGVDGAQHKGTVLVEADTRAGTLVPVWTDVRGRLAMPPRQRNRTVLDTVASGALAAVGVLAFLATVRVQARRALDARRLAQWEAAWLHFEPRWSGRR